MQTEADYTAASNSESKAEKLRILLVEDDSITNEVIQFYLKNDFFCRCSYL